MSSAAFSFSFLFFAFRNEEAKQLEVILKNRDYTVCVLSSFGTAGRGQNKLRYKSTEVVSAETGNVQTSCPLITNANAQWIGKQVHK